LKPAGSLREQAPHPHPHPQLLLISDQAFGGVLYIAAQSSSTASVYLYQNEFKTNFASSNLVVRLRGHKGSWRAVGSGAGCPHLNDELLSNLLIASLEASPH